jgi:valyl-tRNA synthetase
VQDFVLRHLLQLLSPAIPFITQELWRCLRFGEELLQKVPLPAVEELERLLAGRGIVPSELDGQRCAAVREVLADLRALRAEVGGCGPIYQLPGVRWEEGEGVRPLLVELLGCGDFLPLDAAGDRPLAVTRLGSFAADRGGGGQEKLRAELVQLRKHVAANRAKLADEIFLARAPAAVVESTRELLEKNLARLAQLEMLPGVMGKGEK